MCDFARPSHYPPQFRELSELAAAVSPPWSRLFDKTDTDEVLSNSTLHPESRASTRVLLVVFTTYQVRGIPGIQVCHYCCTWYIVAVPQVLLVNVHCCTWFVLIFYDKILVPLPPYATPQDLHSDSPYISQAVGVRVTSWDQVDVGQSTTAPSYE